MKIILILLIGLTSQIVFSQVKNIPNLRESHDLSDYIREGRDDIVPFGIFYGFQPTIFMNSNFVENVKINYGHNFGCSYLYYPFFFELSRFKTYYSASQLELSTVDTAKTRHQGISLSCNFVLFPLIYRATQKIMPNIGIGVQSSSVQLFVGSKWDSESEYLLLGSSNTSGAFWRCGIMFNAKKLYLSFDYKQSINRNRKDAMYQYAITIGGRGLFD